MVQKYPSCSFDISDVNIGEEQKNKLLKCGYLRALEYESTIRYQVNDILLAYFKLKEIKQNTKELIEDKNIKVKNIEAGKIRLVVKGLVKND